MSVEILKFSGRDKWLEARGSGIGASEVASVLGLNPWQTPYQLWRRKRGIDGRQEENFLMTAGHYLEDAVARFYADATGATIIKSSAPDWMMRDTERPYMQVSPDRTFWAAGDAHNRVNKRILECKTTQRTIDADDVPQSWFCQLQDQLGVAGWRFGALGWLSRGRDFGYKDLSALPDFFAWMCGKVGVFWNECVVGGREPEAVDVTDVLLKCRRETSGKIVEGGEDTAAACREIADLKGRIDEMEGRRKELEDRVKMTIADAEGVSFEGVTVATWKANKDSVKFDAKRYQADHPDLCEPYVTTQPGARRLVIKA